MSTKQPKGGYTKSDGKPDGTDTALPKRIVRHIAIMPSTSCCELRALFTRGLITQATTIQCYEDMSRAKPQATLESMRRAVVSLLHKRGWSYARIKENVRFYDSDITTNCVKDAKDWGKKLDWVYLDYCGPVDFTILVEICDNWSPTQFSSDAEISVTSNHKLRKASEKLKPILTALAKHAKKARAYSRGLKPIRSDIEKMIVGIQVGLAYALPFGAVVRESITYARGMTTTRISRIAKVAKRPRGLKGIFDKAAHLIRTRPKQYRGLAPQVWAHHSANPNRIGRHYDD